MEIMILAMGVMMLLVEPICIIAEKVAPVLHEIFAMEGDETE